MSLGRPPWQLPNRRCKQDCGLPVLHAARQRGSRMSSRTSAGRKMCWTSNKPTGQRANEPTHTQASNPTTIQPFNHSTNALPTANNHIRTHTATSDPNADCRRPAGHMEDGTAKHTTARLTNRTNRTHPTRPDRTGPTPTGPRPANAPAEIERNQQRTTTNNNDNNQSERTNEQTNKRTNERTTNATVPQRGRECGGVAAGQHSPTRLMRCPLSLTHPLTHPLTHSLTQLTVASHLRTHSLPHCHFLQFSNLIFCILYVCIYLVITHFVTAYTDFIKTLFE